MEFIGENLLPGIIGYAAIVITFLSSIIVIGSFGLSIIQKEKASFFSKLGHVAYYLNVSSVIVIVLSLFYIINNNLFEYNYAYSHTSVNLPFMYQFSCFWEGQEGSIILWMFWQSLIGLIMLQLLKKWKAETMLIYSTLLFFLSSMLLGIEIGEHMIGINPFKLLRDVMVEAPIFKSPNYLSLISDGNGLNPLLQNYWMVIHPPTLFLGFALMAPPFAYVIAALWRNDYKYFIEPVLKWTLVGAMVLGLGVLMGGAWAYEALSFGGFWAWDPVENASIFPWILLIGALHTLLVYKHTNRSLKFTIVLYLLTLIMVIYSSFLTRSGILGESSVHSFADNGLMLLLVLFLGSITLLGFGFFFARFKELKEVKEEESFSSREFWLFVGGVVFFLSWMQIFFSTSIPVINTIIDSNIAPPTDVVSYYNKWQLPFAVFMALLSGSALFFRYKETAWSKVIKNIIPFIILALLVTILIHLYYPFNIANNILLFSSMYCVLASFKSIIDYSRKNIKKAGAAFTHFSFGVLLVGVVISNGQKEVISINQQNIAFGKGYDLSENRLNTIIYKGSKGIVGDYLVSYNRDSFNYENHFYELKFQEMDLENKSLSDPFYLYPYVQDNPKFGKSANPSTQHYLTYDVFTHITSAYTPSLEEAEVKNQYLGIGDTLHTKSSVIILKNINAKPTHEAIVENDIAIGAVLEVHKEDTIYITKPICLIRDNQWQSITSSIDNGSLQLSFLHIDTEKNQFEIGYLEEAEKENDFIILKAIIFPYINLVWLGTILLVIGFLLSLYNRIQMKIEKS